MLLYGKKNKKCVEYTLWKYDPFCVWYLGKLNFQRDNDDINKNNNNFF